MKIAFNTSVIVFTLAMIGCGSGDEARTEPGGPSVAVSYQAGPLADVEVCLHATSTGPVLAKAISASDGRARFADLPSPEPTEYFVSLQSLGDGGWILDSKFAAAANSGFRLKPLAGNDPQNIDLPRGAVRPLAPTNRR